MRPEAPSPAAAPQAHTRLLAVYAHVAHGHDPVRWARDWASGALVGFNERSPYGYHRADDMGARVTFSTSHAEGALARLVRGGLRVALGFDIVHAWRNRAALTACDVVWTHTESQHLAVLAVLALTRPSRAPKVIAQSVWLIDEWDRIGPLRRALATRLIAGADVLTFLSPLNAARAQAMWPHKRCEFVRFGVTCALKAAPKTQAPQTIHVLSVGNDRHRDWATLVSAFAGEPSVALTIASRTAPRALAAGHHNVTIAAPATQEELEALYRMADVFVLPLEPNLHASGVTVLQEAALFGLPVVATRAGGLEGYFTTEEACFVAPHAPQAMRDAVRTLFADDAARTRLAARLQARMCDDDLSSTAYVARHVALSRELVG